VAVSVARYCSISGASGPLKSASVGVIMKLLEPKSCRISTILGYAVMKRLRVLSAGSAAGHMTPHSSSSASASAARMHAFMSSV